MNKIELLREYKKLLDDNIITQEEFEKKKEQLLNEPDDLVTDTQAEAPNEIDAAPIAPDKRSDEQAPTKSYHETSSSSTSIGWAVLGLIMPIAGLVLYLVWNTTRPAEAKAAGKGALAGFIIEGICYILMMCAVLTTID